MPTKDNTAPEPEVECEDCGIPMNWSFFSDDTYMIQCPFCGYYEDYHMKDDKFIGNGYTDNEE